MILLLACTTPSLLGFPDPAVAAFAELDQDGSGLLEAEELDGGDRTLEDDADGDGALDLDEFREHMATATTSVALDRPGRQGKKGPPPRGKRPPPP